LIDGALSSFYRTFGATDPTVFPHNENVYDSCLYQILQIECAPEPMTLLHEKGLLVNGIEYFTSTQLGGMTKLGKTHEKDFYLSIVEVQHRVTKVPLDSGTEWFADSKRKIAAYMSSKNACKFRTVVNNMPDWLEAIENGPKMANGIDGSTIIKPKCGKCFQLTKHAEKPTGMESINNNLLKEEREEYLKNMKEKEKEKEKNRRDEKQVSAM